MIRSSSAVTSTVPWTFSRMRRTISSSIASSVPVVAADHVLDVRLAAEVHLGGELDSSRPTAQGPVDERRVDLHRQRAARQLLVDVGARRARRPWRSSAAAPDAPRRPTRGRPSTGAISGWPLWPPDLGLVTRCVLLTMRPEAALAERRDQRLELAAATCRGRSSPTPAAAWRRARRRAQCRKAGVARSRRPGRVRRADVDDEVAGEPAAGLHHLQVVGDGALVRRVLVLAAVDAERHAVVLASASAAEALATVAAPSLLKPMRLISACCSGRRKRRGFGLPGCGRGVTVPISRKPKPMRRTAPGQRQFLSKPAARPSGCGSSPRPGTVVRMPAVSGSRNGAGSTSSRPLREEPHADLVGGLGREQAQQRRAAVAEPGGGALPVDGQTGGWGASVASPGFSAWDRVWQGGRSQPPGPAARYCQRTLELEGGRATVRRKALAPMDDGLAARLRARNDPMVVRGIDGPGDAVGHGAGRRAAAALDPDVGRRADRKRHGLAVRHLLSVDAHRDGRRRRSWGRSGRWRRSRCWRRCWSRVGAGAGAGAGAEAGAGRRLGPERGLRLEQALQPEREQAPASPAGVSGPALPDSLADSPRGARRRRTHAGSPGRLSSNQPSPRTDPGRRKKL